MLDFVTQHVSYLGIVMALVLAGLGLPIPEEVVVIVAGVASRHDVLNPWLAFAACLAGAIAGDCVMYSIGYHFGHKLAREHPWYAGFLTVEREKKVERMLAQHGLKVFFVARFLVGLRSPIYLTAGILRIPLRKFLAVDATCATVVVGSFFGLSYVFAKHIHHWWEMIRQAEVAFTVTVVAAVVGVILWIYFRERQRAKAEALAEDAAIAAAISHEPQVSLHRLPDEAVLANTESPSLDEEHERTIA